MPDLDPYLHKAILKNIKTRLLDAGFDVTYHRIPADETPADWPGQYLRINIVHNHPHVFIKDNHVVIKWPWSSRHGTDFGDYFDLSDPDVFNKIVTHAKLKFSSH